MGKRCSYFFFALCFIRLVMAVMRSERTTMPPATMPTMVPVLSAGCDDVCVVEPAEDETVGVK